MSWGGKVQGTGRLRWEEWRPKFGTELVDVASWGAVRTLETRRMAEAAGSGKSCP